jgi:hypothetical protein
MMFEMTPQKLHSGSEDNADFRRRKNGLGEQVGDTLQDLMSVLRLAVKENAVSPCADLAIHQEAAE